MSPRLRGRGVGADGHQLRLGAKNASKRPENDTLDKLGDDNYESGVGFTLRPRGRGVGADGHQLRHAGINVSKWPARGASVIRGVPPR